MKPAIAFIALAALATSTTQAGAADDLLTRMAALNPNLHSFSATMHADVALKSFPFLNVQLVGTYYHKDPDRNKLVFTSGVPAVAQQFDKLYAHIEAPSRWQDVYTVSVVSDDGSTTTYRLVPRKAGNVEHVDAKADDKAATVAWMRWNYANGGYAEMTNRYGKVGGNVVVTSQSGHVQEPGYTADISSTIDNYKINPPLADSLFADQ
jgi:outer membrane lipoprotein-sorting protein